MNRRAVTVMALALGAGALCWLALRDVGEAPLTATAEAIALGAGSAAAEPAAGGALLPAGRSEVAEKATARRATFEERIDAIVALGVRTWDAVDADDQGTAEEIDEETRAEVVLLRRDFEAYDERSLFLLCGLAPGDQSRPGRVRRQVLYTLVELGLRERWQRFGYGASRGPVDAFVDALLAAVPQDEVLARDIGLDLLDDEPFLGPAHEPAVIALLERAQSEPFLTQPAEALLLTLWRNLEGTGARSSAELASLALVFADDTNQSRRSAALRHLLGADGGRYESLVVERARSAGDGELVATLAATAANDLPPDRALHVLEQLAAISPERTTGAFLMLGQRAPETLTTAYEQHLADRIAPHVRAELVTGAGFVGQRLDVAELAFAHDPDPEVRTRALFALSAQRDADAAERALATAIDDPGFADRADRVGAIVAALQNLATAGAVNSVDRLGRRLMSHPLLGAPDRARLEQMLARFTPDAAVPR